MTTFPCPRCLKLARAGDMRAEAVMPLPQGAFAPMAKDGSGGCCLDCAVADGLMSAPGLMSFSMARTVVANDRQENYRLAPLGITMGLVYVGRLRSCDDTLEEHWQWLDAAVPDWRLMGGP